MLAARRAAITARHALETLSSRSSFHALRRHYATIPHLIQDGLDQPKVLLKDAPRPQPSPTKRSKRPSLLGHYFELHPQPVNCTTFQSTKAILADDSHPFYIRTLRRIKAFDRNVFHWRVHVPVDVSKKAAIRDKVKKQLRHAFTVELKRRGYKKDGTIREAEGKGLVAAGLNTVALKGALLISVNRDGKRALTFTEEEARENVKFVLDQVLFWLKQAENRGGWRGRDNSRTDQHRKTQW